MQFNDFSLHPHLLSALGRAGFSAPTPIQARAIPPAMTGRDVIGAAQTGTGKTAAFGLPILHHLLAQPQRASRAPRALVLTPTRELASQVGETFQDFARGAGLKTTVIFGGVSQVGQEKALSRGVDVLVATPGRLLDLLGQGLLRLDELQFFVLDEADRMLDMGFIHDIRRIVQALPAERQTLLFSATFPKELRELAHGLLKNPVEVAVDPVASMPTQITQRVCFVPQADKTALLLHLLQDKHMDRVLVFTRTKHVANRLVTTLQKKHINAEAIHGNKSQAARERALAGFKTGEVRVLVATDLASRGLHVEDVSHVVNYELPNEPESYVHRIGRTGRAGQSGEAISFCNEEERVYLRDIEKLTGHQAEVDDAHPFAPGFGRLAPREYQAPPARRSPGGPPHAQRQPRGQRPGGQQRPAAKFRGPGHESREEKPAQSPRQHGKPRREKPDAPAPRRATPQRTSPGGHVVLEQGGVGGHAPSGPKRRRRPPRRRMV